MLLFDDKKMLVRTTNIPNAKFGKKKTNKILCNNIFNKIEQDLNKILYRNSTIKVMSFRMNHEEYRLNLKYNSIVDIQFFTERYFLKNLELKLRIDGYTVDRILTKGCYFPTRYINIKRFQEIEKIGDYLKANNAKTMCELIVNENMRWKFNRYPILEIQTLILLILCNVRFKYKFDDKGCILHSIPYDVVKIIMMKLWDTRYDSIWNKTFSHLNSFYYEN